MVNGLPNTIFRMTEQAFSDMRWIWKWMVQTQYTIMQVIHQHSLVSDITVILQEDNEVDNEHTKNIKLPQHILWKPGKLKYTQIKCSKYLWTARHGLCPQWKASRVPGSNKTHLVIDLIAIWKNAHTKLTKAVDYYLPHMTNPKVDNQETDRHNDIPKPKIWSEGIKAVTCKLNNKRYKNTTFLSQNHNNSNCNNQLYKGCRGKFLHNLACIKEISS